MFQSCRTYFRFSKWGSLNSIAVRIRVKREKDTEYAIFMQGLFLIDFLKTEPLFFRQYEFKNNMTFFKNYMLIVISLPLSICAIVS
jgi:hypothetical protein